MKRAPLRKFDASFALMGLFFVAMALFEYLFPGGSGIDRSAVKMLNGCQVAFAFLVVIFSPGLSNLARWLPLSFLFLCFWLSALGIVYSESMASTLYMWMMYFYWYSLFLFFYVRCRTRPEQLHLFLTLAACSLLVWVPALFNFTTVNSSSRGIPMRLQAQNYVGYYIVALFPYMLLLKRRILKIIAVLLISYGAVYSLKRGVVLALVLMGFSASCLHLTVLSKKRGKVVIGLVLLWGIAIGAGSLFIYANPEAITRRMASDTGRTRIYIEVYEAIKRAEIYQLVIGHGSGQLQATIGHEPHNDWFLLLYDFGVVGVVLMLNVYIVLLFFLLKLCKLKSPLSLPLISVFVLMTCVQLYSTGLYLKIFGFITGCIGLVAGCHHADCSKAEKEAGINSSGPKYLDLKPI